MMFLSINVGFITNSSSCVHCFPAELLKDPDVAAVLDAYALHDGYAPERIDYRSLCDSVLIHDDQKKQVLEAICSDGDVADEYTSAHNARWKEVMERPNSVVITYGDEHDSLARTLCEVLSAAWNKKNDGSEYSPCYAFDFH